MARIRRRAAMTLVAVAALLAGLIATSAPAGATVVSTEAQYLAAFNNAAETNITLAADITFTCPAFASRVSVTPLTIDGQGHTINGCATGINHSAVGDLNFVDVTLNGGTLVLSNVGNLTLTNTTVTSTAAAPLLGVSTVGNVSVTDTQIGPLTSTGNVLAFSVVGDVSFQQSRISNVQSGTVAIAYSVVGETAFADSTIDSIDGASTSLGLSGVANLGEAFSVVRSTISNVTGDGTVIPVSIVGQTIDIVNSTISNNGGPAVVTALDSLSVVYSDIVENTGLGAGAGAVSTPEMPPLPEDAPEGLVLATPQLPEGLGELSAQQVDAQLLIEGDTNFFGTVVALPQGGVVNCDIAPAATSSGYNFSDDATCGFTNVAAGDRENAGDPLLGPLASNGGFTATRLPLTGSPLIDFIPLAACQSDGAAGVTTDQRLLPRPSGAGCEIGSVEIQLVVLFTG